MSIRIFPLGGFEESGRNSVAVEINNKIIILDMGFHLERFVQVTESDISGKKSPLRKLLAAKALPDIRSLRRLRKNVVGIVCSHAHLDHIGAIPFLANKFNCPVYATPFTAAVIRSLSEDRTVSIQINQHLPGECFIIDDIKIDFVPVAHSTPQTVIIVIHTPDGAIVYANDYKDDEYSPFEQAKTLETLKKLQGKVRLLFLDSLYAPKNEHCPSEQLARQEVLALKSELSSARAIIASTFSSQIYRLVSLCDLADSLGREVVFIGRSLGKYITAAQDAQILDLSKRGTIIKFSSQAKSFLRNCAHPEKYFLIVTGHQGEPQAILSRMANGLFAFTRQDEVIFSCNTIPTPTIQKNRKVLEENLHSQEVKMHKDVHVSGHAFAKDHKKLLDTIQPEYIVPLHGEPFMLDMMEKRLLDWGFSPEKILRLRVGQRKELNKTFEQ